MILSGGFAVLQAPLLNGSWIEALVETTFDGVRISPNRAMAPSLRRNGCRVLSVLTERAAQFQAQGALPNPNTVASVRVSCPAPKSMKGLSGIRACLILPFSLCPLSGLRSVLALAGQVFEFLEAPIHDAAAPVATGQQPRDKSMNAPADINSTFRPFAEALAREAAELVRESFEAASVSLKPDGSPVTSVDLAVERALRQRIEHSFPDHGILGEEFGARNLEADWIWVIDPIDGTRQFAAGLPNFGILIALCHRRQPMLGIICQPQIGDLYVGVTGTGAWLNDKPINCRSASDLDKVIVCFSDPDAFTGKSQAGFEALRQKSAWNVYDGGCLSFGALAAGHIGVSLCGPNLDCFDICALVPVADGAGGRITDWHGKALDFSSSGAIVASASAELHQEVLATLNNAPARHQE